MSSDPIRGRNKAGLAQALTALGLRVRFDKRSRTTQWYAATDGWNSGTDRGESWLRETIAERFHVTDSQGRRTAARFGRDTWSTSLGALLAENEVDAFLERLDALPAWDRTRRLDTILVDLWGRPDGEVGDTGTLREWASRYPFLAAVQRARDPGCKLREIPVLVGAQRCCVRVGLAPDADRALQIPMRESRRFGAALSGAGYTKSQGRRNGRRKVTLWYQPEA